MSFRQARVKRSFSSASYAAKSCTLGSLTPGIWEFHPICHPSGQRQNVSCASMGANSHVALPLDAGSDNPQKYWGLHRYSALQGRGSETKRGLAHVCRTRAHRKDTKKFVKGENFYFTIQEETGKINVNNRCHL